jgi:ClpP class serine protease
MKIDFMSLLWIFFMIAALQPILRQRMLDSARQRLIAAIEKKRNSRVITLVHRQETMSFLGFPIMKFIDLDDSEEVIRAIHMTDPEVPLDLILHTPGGIALAAFQISHAIKNRKGKITAFVPHYAMSGGTMIALAADEIVMGEHAVLGPVDPQIGEFPAASLLKLIDAKPIADIDDKTWILADIGKKALEQLRSQVRYLLDGKYDPDKSDKLAQILSEGRWTHDYPISYEEAELLGLHVSKELPQEVYQLMGLYPQPVRHRPSVEYTPAPKFKDHGGRS